jgi:hypothetical protein
MNQIINLTQKYFSSCQKWKEIIHCNNNIFKLYIFLACQIEMIEMIAYLYRFIIRVEGESYEKPGNEIKNNEE